MRFPEGHSASRQSFALTPAMSPTLSNQQPHYLFEACFYSIENLYCAIRICESLQFRAQAMVAIVAKIIRSIL
jgi:hypothetical protein